MILVTRLVYDICSSNACFVHIMSEQLYFIFHRGNFLPSVFCISKVEII